MASVTADVNAIVYTAKLSNDKSQVKQTEVTDYITPAGNAVLMKPTADKKMAGTIMTDNHPKKHPDYLEGNLFLIIFARSKTSI